MLSREESRVAGLQTDAARPTCWGPVHLRAVRQRAVRSPRLKSLPLPCPMAEEPDLDRRVPADAAAEAALGPPSLLKEREGAASVCSWAAQLAPRLSVTARSERPV